MRADVVPITRITVKLTLEPEEVENLRDAIGTAMARLDAPVPSVNAGMRTAYNLALKTLQPFHDVLARAVDQAAEAIDDMH